MKVSKDPMRAFSQGDTLGRILTYRECLETGTKLVAETLVNKRDIDWVVELIEETEGCECQVNHNHSECHVHIYLFKYPWARQLLRGRHERSTPKSALDTWVNGKLFGYSDYEIALALEEEEYIDSALT